MAFEFNGASIETTATGFLVNQDDWSEDLARAMAAAEGIPELTDRHWDVINYLREEYFDNHENQPNTRTIIKAMSEKWGEKIKQSDLYALFPMDPSKQGGRIAGLPESKRKGGY
ncbi:MAG: TusE/DsrC/DsvC family sulfur relay protein [Alphaproteobacteria bacterium]|nr:MAG: TusE/DsrC/DsvC family sulfur relay protein [Alphaproteobacteria bacterium]